MATGAANSPSSAELHDVNVSSASTPSPLLMNFAESPSWNTGPHVDMAEPLSQDRSLLNDEDPTENVVWEHPKLQQAKAGRPLSEKSHLVTAKGPDYHSCQEPDTACAQAIPANADGDFEAKTESSPETSTQEEAPADESPKLLEFDLLTSDEHQRSSGVGRPSLDTEMSGKEVESLPEESSERVGLLADALGEVNIQAPVDEEDDSSPSTERHQLLTS